MTKPRSPSAISREKRGEPAAAVTTNRPEAPALSPGVAARDVRRRPWAPWLAAGALLAVLAGGAFAWQWWSARATPANAPGGPANDDWSQAPVTDAERLCADFVRLKNAHDPAAAALLGPTPTVPPGPVTRAEADRIETDLFLRQELRVVGARRGRTPGMLVLATKGNVSAPRLLVRDGAAAPETEQRTMSNPDLTIEVRDGKIYGTRAALAE
jgi:hypothetical protein